MSIEELKRPERIDEERIEKLKELFPEAFMDGQFNLDIIKEEITALSEEHILDGSGEYYALNWTGKSEARKLASLPPKGTLRGQIGSGVNEGDTENFFIKGDNLEVLRILKKSYSQKVKMIYIDPPYNTGSDLLYKDNFKEPIESYLQKAGQSDEEGLLTSNPKSSGRFHANWLNMIYPRLRLAKDLLSQDGIIIVSISDNEQANLKLMMDSIFGTENFIAQLVWNTEGHTDNQFHVKVNHEYLLMYVKNPSYKNQAIGNVIDPNTREESNLWKGFAENSITKNGKANPPSEIVLPKGFPCVVDYVNLDATDVTEEYFNEVDKIGYITRELTRKYNVTYPIRRNKMIVSKGLLETECKVFSGWANVNKLQKFIDNNCKPIEDGEDKLEFYLSKKGVIYYRREREQARNILSVLRNMGTTEQMRSSLEDKGIKFDYPKPVELIKYLLKIGTKKDSLIMDFFAGSGTTARAVYDLNTEDEGTRNYILVQLEEAISDSDYPDIAALTLERIKRDIQEINAIDKNENDLDRGVSVYKMSKSSIRKWDLLEAGDKDHLQGTLNLFSSQPFLEEMNEEDIITELLLIEGFSLDSKVKTTKIDSNHFWFIEHQNTPYKLVVCLDESLKQGSEEHLITNCKRDTLICLDNALSDKQKVLLSEAMNVKTI